MMHSNLRPRANRVLLVDDDQGLRTEISSYLRDHGFEVSIAKDATEMDRVMSNTLIDVIVLDIMMPGEDGLSVCRRLAGLKSPSILVLSGARSEADRIVGLELGADDYLGKPCAPRELLARIRALLRTKKTTPQPAIGCYAFEGFILDPWRRQIHDPAGTILMLSTGEFLLLKAFLEHPNQALSRDELLNLTFGDQTDVYDRAIDVQVSRLRRRFTERLSRDPIVTMRGVGYMFDCAVIHS